jgi:hypothetical protein
MKTQLFKAICMLSCAISCGATWAQDSKRVPDANQGVDAVDSSVHADVVAVDPSVHAGVDEIAPQGSQPASNAVKPAATSSHWGIAPAAQPSVTQFWPAHPNTTSSADTSADGKGALPRTPPPHQNGTQPSPSALSSAHAGIDTSAQTESAGRNIASPSTSPSFQAGAKQIPSTAWSLQPRGASLETGDTDNSGTAESQANSLNRLGSASDQNPLEGPQHPRAVTAPVSPQSDGFSSPFSPHAQGDGFPSPFSGPHQADGFSSPFSASQVESRPLSQANSSQKRNQARAKEHTHSSQKTPDSTHTGAVAKFPNQKEKSAASGAAAKTE